VPCGRNELRLINKARERRIEFRGLSQEIESSLGVSAPDWQEEIDLGIWIDQVLRGHDRKSV